VAVVDPASPGAGSAEDQFEAAAALQANGGHASVSYEDMALATLQVALVGVLDGVVPETGLVASVVIRQPDYIF